MKKLLFLFLSLAVILPACKDDDDVINENVLQYDGDNLSAPVFEEGVSEPAVYFPSNYLQSYIGKRINGIEFFVADIPAEMEIKILQAGSGNTPGLPLFSAVVPVADVTPTAWNGWNLAFYQSKA